MIPTSIFRVWLVGLFSCLLVGLGLYAGHEWYRGAWGYDFERQQSYFDPHLGLNLPTLLLAGAVGLLVWALLGRLLVRALVSLWAKAKGTGDSLPPPNLGGQAAVVSRLERPDGSELQVEQYGPEDAPTIILTHGWGADRSEWDYLRRDLGNRFQLIVWDLPGLGRSRPPANRDYGLENLAGHLHVVLAVAGERPTVLLGHSIGGMITLTFGRLFPQELGTRVAGLALVQTTYTNPVRTTQLAGLLSALERPVLVPLLGLTIRLAPLVWLMNQLSYFNGSAHLSTLRSGFAGNQTWEQVERMTRLGVKAWPAVLARGMLGMLRYDATATLKAIPVPTLVIAGDRDPVCTPEASNRMRQDIVGSHLVVALSPAKHMGLIEHHARFAEGVGQFARACLQPKPPLARGRPLTGG